MSNEKKVISDDIFFTKSVSICKNLTVCSNINGCNELSHDVGHKPIVFIRFNPDDYEENKIVINSCWGLDKKGICVIKKSKSKEWSQRLNTH